MATRTRKAKVSLLDDRINVLNRNAVEASSAKQVFRTVSATLALVRDKLIDDKDSVQLSEYCFNVCDVLKTAVQGRDADNLDESVRLALEDLGRITEEIERTLRRAASMPRTKHNKGKVEASVPRTKHDKGKVEGQKLRIQEILGTLGAPSTPLNEVLPVDSRDNATTAVPESACGRLVRRAFALHELPSMIEVIFSSQDQGDTIRRLLGDDAQVFVDVIDEALDRPDLSLQTRENCLKSLYRMCGRHALLPTSLKIPVSFERTGDALYRGGFADVWKGEHCGRDVAVKVVRIYSDSDLRRVVGRFCKEVVAWKTLRHPNVLPLIGVTMSETRFAMISDWMVNGNITRYVKAHPEANRLELLRDVTKGLIYIHNQGMIHGDLKGANILIDQTAHARVADFGLLTIISNPKYLLSSSSHSQGGTVRWMSPERIAPDQFGCKNSRPTISSDCYALGMVVYETISGNFPFHKDADLTVSLKVVGGKRPPQGAKFTKSLWGMLERCWASRPNDRPRIEAVLQCLEMDSSLPGPSSPGVDEETEEDDDYSDSTVDSSGTLNWTSGAVTTEGSAATSTLVQPGGATQLPVANNLSMVPRPNLRQQWHGMFSSVNANGAHEAIVYVSVEFAQNAEPHLATWPSKIQIAAVQEKVVTPQEFHLWTNQNNGTLCRVMAQRRPEAPNNEGMLRQLVNSLAKKSMYAVASWPLPNGGGIRKMMVLVAGGGVLMGAVFPLTGFSEMPKAGPAPQQVIQQTPQQPTPEQIRAMQARFGGTRGNIDDLAGGTFQSENANPATQWRRHTPQQPTPEQIRAMQARFGGTGRNIDDLAGGTFQSGNTNPATQWRQQIPSELILESMLNQRRQDGNG